MSSHVNELLNRALGKRNNNYILAQIGENISACVA